MCSYGDETLAPVVKQKDEQNMLATENITETETLQAVRMQENTPVVNQTEKKPSFLSKVNPFVGKNESADAAEVKQAKTMKHYHAVKKEAFKERESRRNAGLQNPALEEMCEKHRNSPHATPEFLEVIDSIVSFLHTETDSTQQKALASARQKIKNYLKEHDGSQNDREYELWMHIQAYEAYLDMNTNGSLDMKGVTHKEGEHEENPKTRAFTVWRSVKDQALFPHEPSASDIQQRTTQDCYMLASLTSIAHFTPDYIKQAIRDNGDGTVTVRFFDEKESDVYYETETIEELTKNYSEATETEKENIDRKLLVKLFSTFSVNKDLQEKLRKDWKDTSSSAEEVREDKKEVQEEKKEASKDIDDAWEVLDFEETEKEIDDDFELIDDFETETKTTTVAKENPVVKGYLSRLKILQSSFLSSNEAWMNEIVDAILKSNSAAGENLKKVLNRIHSGASDQAETIAGEAFEEFIKQMCTDATSNEELHGLMRKAGQQTEEKKCRNEAVYVTVTKEVSRFAGAVDAYATDAVWVQMIEKAYAVHYGEGKGYEGISLGKSSDFLNYFLNQDYDPGINRYILNAPMEDFEVHGVKITQETITAKVRQIQQKKKSVAVSVEDMLRQLEADEACQAIFQNREAVEELASQLVEKFGMVHDAFSRKYTEQAVNIFEDYRERLRHKECIAVGCTYREKEEEDWLTGSGIRNRHAYSVVDCFEEDGHKFVTLRDPYALFKREYVKETDENGVESYRIVNASSIGLSKNDSDGLFNMEWNDYLMTFNEYTALKRH